MKLKNIDIEKVSAALEADAGHALAGILESLAEAKAASPPQTLTGSRDTSVVDTWDRDSKCSVSNGQSCGTAIKCGDFSLERMSSAAKCCVRYKSPTCFGVGRTKQW